MLANSSYKLHRNAPKISYRITIATNIVCVVVVVGGRVVVVSTVQFLFEAETQSAISIVNQ